MYLTSADLYFKPTVIVPLTSDVRRLYFNAGGGHYHNHREIPIILPDFGGVPDDWKEILEQKVIPLLASGETILAFCTASHGRTGTFLASLIALLESPEETPDPVAAVRERHCHHAVETKKQAIGIFALRGQSLPEEYEREFASGISCNFRA